jgi:hypothetical protein
MKLAEVVDLANTRRPVESVKLVEDPIMPYTPGTIS